MVDPWTIFHNLQRMRNTLKERGIDVPPIPEPMTVLPNSIPINGKMYSPFDRIKVRSLVSRSDRGVRWLRPGSNAELWVMPTPAGAASEYRLVAPQGIVVLEHAPIEGKHFDFIDVT